MNLILTIIKRSIKKWIEFRYINTKNIFDQSFVTFQLGLSIVYVAQNAVTMTH